MSIVNLTPEQLQIISTLDGQLKSLQMEFNHAMEKKNSFVAGITTSKGINGQFKYEIKDGKLIIDLPETPQQPEE